MGIIETIKEKFIGAKQPLRITVPTTSVPEGYDPSKPDVGYTITTSQRGTTITRSDFKSRFTGGGLGRRGRVGPSGPTPAERAAEFKRLADIKAAELKAKKAAQDAARKAAADRLAEIRGKRAAADISRIRRDIQARGGRTTTKISRDVRTGRELEITETRGKEGRLIREVKDVETGEVKVTEFGPGVAGGGVRLKRGVISTGEVAPEVITREAGVRTFTEAEARAIGEKNLPVGSIIILDSASPADILAGRGTRLAKLPEPEVQPVTTSFFGRVADLPAKAIEKVTGRKPREVFRFITGAPETDVTKPVTLGEAIVEPTQVPIRAVSILGAGLGVGAEAVTRRVAPEGISVVFGEREAREIIVREPQFGTVQIDPVTGQPITGERVVTIPKRGVRTVKIFEPERVGTGVRAGTVIAATVVAPLAFAPGFVAGGTQTALDPTKEPLERLFGAGEAVLGGTIIGARVIKFARTPVVIRKPLRPIKTPEAIEIQKVVQIRKKPTTISVFEIRGEISPPVIITRTTKGRQVLDFFGKQAEKVVRVGDKPVVSLRRPPTIERIIPAKTFSIRTPEPVIGKAPFLVSEVQTGRRLATISRITGTERPISLSEFKQLSKIEQFILQRRAEQLAGRKMPLGQVPKFLAKEKQRVSAFIESEKLLKVRVRPRIAEFELIPPGRRITRAVGVTEAEKVATTDALELIKAKTLFKDVTFPGARAAGRTPTLDTIILRIKPIPDPKDAVRFIAPADIKRTPFSTTFPAPVQITQPPITSLAGRVPLPKPKPVAPTTTILEPTITPTARVFPSIVGGIGGPQVESIFAGTGQFEVTTPQVIGIVRPSMIDAQRPTVQPRVDFLQIQPQVEVSKQIRRPTQIELQKSIEAQKSIQQLRQIELQKSIEAQKSIQRQQQAQLLSLRPSQLFRQPSLPSPPRPPTTTPLLPPPILGSPAQRAVIKLAKQVKGDFEIFARIEGVDVSIGKAKTLKKAAKKLSKKLKGTLAASGFLVEGGRRLSAIETGLIDGEFRQSFIDVGRVVQRKEKRLGTLTETKQLQFFRKQGGGGNLFGSSAKRKRRSNSGFSFFQ